MNQNLYKDHDQKDKLLHKFKKNPSVPIGIAGFIGVVAYGLYNFKNKELKTSIYLIHLRVAAQGAVIGCISLGLLYTVCKKSLKTLFPDPSKNNENV